MGAGSADTERRIRGSRVLVILSGRLGLEVLHGLLDDGLMHIVAAGSDIPETDGRVTVLRKEPNAMDSWNYDLIICCLGDAGKRLYVNSRAKEYRIPLIDGTVDGGRGRIQTVLPEGPCLECGLDRSRRTSLKAAVSEPDSGAVAETARIIREEALKILAGEADRCLKGIVYYDSEEGTSSVLPMGKDPKCPHHANERPARRVVPDMYRK